MHAPSELRACYENLQPGDQGCREMPEFLLPASYITEMQGFSLGRNRDNTRRGRVNPASSTTGDQSSSGGLGSSNNSWSLRNYAYGQMFQCFRCERFSLSYLSSLLCRWQTIKQRKRRVMILRNLASLHGEQQLKRSLLRNNSQIPRGRITPQWMRISIRLPLNFPCIETNALKKC